MYGESEFKISYLDTTWQDITADYSVYSSKYQFNIDDSINLKTILGERVKLHKGMHHKFNITFQIGVTSTLYNELMLAQSSPVRMFPHKDFDKYYNCIITLVKPFYLKQNVYCDAITVNIETSDYQPLEFVLPVHNIIEAFHLGDNTDGLNSGTYYTVGTNVVNSSGKINNCLEMPSGNNGIIIENTEYTNNTTLNLWCKIPSNTGTGSILNISDSNLEDPYIEFNKEETNGDGTVNLTILNGLTNKGTIIVNEDQWFLITILMNDVSCIIYINDELKLNASISTGTTQYIALGLGSVSKTSDVYFDEFILSDRLSENTQSDNQDYWYNNGIGRTFKTVKYHVPVVITNDNLFYIAHNPSQPLIETNNLFYIAHNPSQPLIETNNLFYTGSV
jgi:hypothetical protein